MREVIKSEDGIGCDTAKGIFVGEPVWGKLKGEKKKIKIRNKDPGFL